MLQMKNVSISKIISKYVVTKENDENCTKGELISIVPIIDSSTSDPNRHVFYIIGNYQIKLEDIKIHKMSTESKTMFTDMLTKKFLIWLQHTVLLK